MGLKEFIYWEEKTHTCFHALCLIQSSLLTSPRFWINLISFSPTPRVLRGKSHNFAGFCQITFMVPRPSAVRRLLGSSFLSRAHTPSPHSGHLKALLSDQLSLKVFLSLKRHSGTHSNCHLQYFFPDPAHLFFVCSERVSCSPGEFQSCYVDQADLDFPILLAFFNQVLGYCLVSAHLICFSFSLSFFFMHFF